MKLLAFLMIPAAVLASPARVARVGEIEGKVEVQLHATDAWRAAVRNLPVVESSWVRSAAGAQVEIELDEGSVLRLTGDALCEFSDYTRLSTGQRVSLISLDHGLAYFTGEPDRRDALILAVPGAQATVRSGSRVRLEARDDASQISVLEGVVRFSSPSAELELHEGQMARVETTAQSRFFLYREIPPLDSDRWNEQRDKALAVTGSASHVPGLQYGLADLDANGSWIGTSEYGLAWRPKVDTGWTPYRDGQWLWYEEVGYTWIANEPWGWLPFHYGRWVEQSRLGWVWSPGRSAVFKPGEVYWLREPNLVGWGPLAPGETWDARSTPRQYLRANTTLAQWRPDARELVPLGPSEKLKTTQAGFVIAPPSPAFDAARLDVVRPVLRAGGTRVVPIIPGVTYAPNAEVAQAPQPPAPPSPPQPAAPADASIPAPQGGQTDVYVPVPVPEPVEVYYPVPVYTGIVVVNPPDDRDHRRVSRPASPGMPSPGMPRGENREHRAAQPVSQAPQPVTRPEATAPQPAAPAQPTAPAAPIPRSSEPPRTGPSTAAPLPRTSEPPRAASPPPQHAAEPPRGAPPTAAPPPPHTPEPPRAAPPPQRADPPRSNDSGDSKSGQSSGKKS